ncbi:hypothetical protein CSB92_0001, partial [Pseudomonas aeruginosa]
YNPLGHATEQTTNLILLDREARTSKLVFNPNSYAAGNKKDTVWHRSMERPGQQPAAGDHRRLDSVILRPNIGVLGRRTAPSCAVTEDREGIQRHARRRGHGADGLPAGAA